MTSLDELLRRVINKSKEQIRVSIPATIESYDATTSIASVKITVPQILEGEEVRDPGIINDVPVMWLGNSNSDLTFPLKKGDHGLLIFADSDIGGWTSNLGSSIPSSVRMHSINDAMFLPQFHGNKPSSLVGTLIRCGATTLNVSEQSVTIVNGATTVVVNTAGVQITAPAVAIAGNLTVTGSITSNTATTPIDVGTHKHSGVQSGPSLTGLPQ